MTILQRAARNHRLSGLVDVSWELVSVPAVLIIAAVGVDAAEQASVNSGLQLVRE